VKGSEGFSWSKTAKKGEKMRKRQEGGEEFWCGRGDKFVLIKNGRRLRKGGKKLP